MNIPVTIKEGTATLTVDLKEGKQNLPIKVRTETSYYEDGYSDGFTDGVLVGEKEYIENILPDKEKAAYDEGYAKGEDDQYQALWDAATSGGTQSGGAYDLSYRFAGQSWTYGYESLKDTFVPPIGKEIKANTGTAAGMFRSCRITDLTKALEDRKAVLNTSNARSLSYAFAYGYLTDIPKIDLRGTATNTDSDHGTGYIFAQAQSKQKLKTIREIVVNENVVLQSTTFHQCGALEEIHFTGKFNNPFYFNKTPALITFTFEKTENEAGKVNGVNAILKPVKTSYYITTSTEKQNGYIIDLSKCTQLSPNSLRYILIGLEPWNSSLKYSKPTLLLNQEQKDRYFTTSSPDYLYINKGDFADSAVENWGSLSYTTSHKGWNIEVSQS